MSEKSAADLMKDSAKKIREYINTNLVSDSTMTFAATMMAIDKFTTIEETKKQIINFLRELKASDETIVKIYTYGSCFRLYKMLKVLYPQAQALYSHSDGHWITKIDKYYYDINGRISEKYVKEKDYILEPESESSAYIPTHTNNIGTHYNKYDEI